jgi:hypothetical protein
VEGGSILEWSDDEGFFFVVFDEVEASFARPWEISPRAERVLSAVGDGIYWKS